MKRALIIAISLLLVVPSFGWGRLGHATVARIAENHLTKTAEEQLSKYLNGSSIVEYASYADEYKDKLPFVDGIAYPHTFEVNMDFEPFKGIYDGDRYVKNCVHVIETFAGELRDARNMTDSLRFLEIVLTVHFVGDMHCPEHIRYNPEDMTIGYYKVKYGNEDLRYHTYWDDRCLATYPWSFGDLAYLFDDCSEKEIAEITAGGPYDWARDCAEKSWPVHLIKEGDTLTRDWQLETRVLAKTQIRNAGYRLAKLLNIIFDPKYARKYQKNPIFAK